MDINEDRNIELPQEQSWHDVLEDCPCTVDEAEKSEHFVSGGPFEKLSLDIFHPGADSSFRSVNPTEVTNSEGDTLNAGQQCTYDGEGKLITSGAAAGTPDIVSPTHSKLDHFVEDVIPWAFQSVEEYNESWLPNQGTDCPENPVNETFSNILEDNYSSTIDRAIDSSVEAYENVTESIENSYKEIQESLETFGDNFSNLGAEQVRDSEDTSEELFDRLNLQFNSDVEEIDNLEIQSQESQLKEYFESEISDSFWDDLSEPSEHIIPDFSPSSYESSIESFSDESGAETSFEAF